MVCFRGYCSHTTALSSQRRHILDACILEHCRLIICHHAVVKRIIQATPEDVDEVLKYLEFKLVKMALPTVPEGVHALGKMASAIRIWWIAMALPLHSFSQCG